MRYSYSDRVAQVVERDASNIKVVSSILTAVKVIFTFPVETIGGPIQCVISYRDQCAHKYTS